MLLLKTILLVSVLIGNYNFNKIDTARITDVAKCPLCEVYTNHRDITALKSTLFFEVRGQPVEDWNLVFNVIENRVNDDKFKNTPYEVIHSPSQFSYLKIPYGERIRTIKKEEDTYSKISDFVDIRNTKIVDYFLGETDIPNRDKIYFYHSDIHNPEVLNKFKDRNLVIATGTQYYYGLK